MAFWAWGVHGDLTKMPFPHPLSTVVHEESYHTFRVFLNAGGCYWAMAIDQYTPDYHFASVECSQLDWTPTQANNATEVWNSGDQIGGFSWDSQYFYNEWFQDLGGGIHYFIDDPFKSGHCYPQANWGWGGTVADWKVLTSTVQHDPC